LALGVTDMLDSDMNALLDDAAVDLLVDTDSDGGLGNVEDDSGASVVSLVGHTLMDGGIGKDVDVVPDVDVHQVLTEMDGTMLPMFLGKHVARTRSDSEGMRHLVWCSFLKNNDLRFCPISCVCMYGRGSVSG